MKYVIANWKQNKTLVDAINWCSDFVRLVEGVDLGEVAPVICPPTPFLEKLKSLLEPHGIDLGVQDVSAFTDGAHTGFVGVDQIKQLCKYAIVGHSERQEPRDLVIDKAKLCLSANVTPVVCYKSADDYEIIDGAIYALEDPDNISVDGIYRAKKIQDVEEMVDSAKRFFGQNSCIIYGGSVNEENAQALAVLNNLNGVLVGNASLQADEFANIVKEFSL